MKDKDILNMLGLNDRTITLTDDEFKSKMSEVYRKQVNDLELLVSNYK